MLSNTVSILATVLYLFSLGAASADAWAGRPEPQAISNSSRPAIVAYSAPAEENLSADFELTVGSQKVPVYRCRVSAMPFNQSWPGYQRPLDQTEIASFAYWDMSGPVEIEVISRRPVESVAIRPTSRGIQDKVDKNRITFRLSAPQQITVEVNGWHKALHLFANGPQAAAPSPQDPSVRYFGPGVHRPGKIVLESKQTVYLAGGAVVYGMIEAQDAAGIRILGRGILDTSLYERDQLAGCIHLRNCKNVTIDGIVLRDPPAWCLSMFACTDVRISNVKLIGLWRYNSDGIDICDSQQVTVRNSFIRSFDDSIVIKGLNAADDTPIRNILVEGCVVWNDWGRALEIGAETRTPELSDIVFRDCDVVRTTHVALDIQHSDRAAIRNVLFERIRCEIDDVNLKPIIQKRPDEQFVGDTQYCPRLLVLEIVKSGNSHDAQRGTIENVTVRDVSVTGKHSPPSLLRGYDEQYQVKGVTIENLRVNGRVVKSLEEAGVKANPFVQDVRILAP